LRQHHREAEEGGTRAVPQRVEQHQRPDQDDTPGDHAGIEDRPRHGDSRVRVVRRQRHRIQPERDGFPEQRQSREDAWSEGFRDQWVEHEFNGRLPQSA
jgi:hypothetical protein